MPHTLRPGRVRSVSRVSPARAGGTDATPPGPATPAVVIEDHIDWAVGVARGVARAYQFRRGSQEEGDLEGIALVALCRTAAAFDPDRVPAGGDPAGAYRGYAHRELQSQCRREARRLRNGGTYRTRREAAGRVVIALPAAALADPERVAFFDLPGRESDPADMIASADPPPAPWVPFTTD